MVHPATRLVVNYILTAPHPTLFAELRLANDVPENGVLTSGKEQAGVEIGLASSSTEMKTVGA
jgi:hypothetical protein